MIIVPQGVLDGLIVALHIQFNHPTFSQLTQIFDRYFYSICSAATIKRITQGCDLCNALIRMPNELKEQSSSALPTALGQKFSSDIIRRCKQKIFVTRELFSSFTSATIIPDETAASLRSALLSTTAFLRQPMCSVKVDGATGFIPLKDDKILRKHGIDIEVGRAKNPNKNPIVDKGIQELEKEFLTAELDGQQLCQSSLDICLHRLNAKIRHNGLSSKEIVTHRDQITGCNLNFQDKDLVEELQTYRSKNREYSSCLLYTSPSPRDS